MKDAYSFDIDEVAAKVSYNKMFYSYLKTFDRLEIKAIPMAADTGPIGGELSHEFIILADTGESNVYADKNIFNITLSKYQFNSFSLEEMRKEFSSYYAVTDEKFNQNDFEKNVKKENQILTKGIEVGHIFYFGDKYSKVLNCLVDHQEGKKVPVKMGSYGIGVSRLVGAIIEAKYINGIMKWPRSITPFDAVIIPSINKNNSESIDLAFKIYKELKDSKIDVLLDDTDENLSSKFKKHDLIGIPFQIIIGSKIEENKFEFKEVGKQATLLNLKAIIEKLKN